jgi:dATP/dGTP diphosphohydrolase
MGRVGSIGHDNSHEPRDDKPKRDPVDYRYDAVNPDFLKMLARIGAYASEKYGTWEKYTGGRLVGEKSPVNHIQEHLRQFIRGEPYDHFDGDVRWHLAAIAYNAMMEFYYVTRWGHLKHPLTVEPPGPHEGPAQNTPVASLPGVQL